MTPPSAVDAGQPADPASVRHLGELLLARVPDLASILREDLGVQAAIVFATDGRVDDAVTELTEAVAICGVGTVRDDFQSSTSVALATLIGGWRRAGLPGSDLTAGLARLGDQLVEELFRLRHAGAAARARAAACVLDATQILIRRMDSTFRSWESSRDSDDVLSLGLFEEALALELRNRIHAAETALDLLRRSSEVAPLSDDDRRRLHHLLLDAISVTRRSVYDMRRINAFEPSNAPSVSIPFSALVRRTVERVRRTAAEQGVEIDISESVSEEPVDARAAQIALNNLLDVAVRRSSRSGGGRLRLQTAAPSEQIEIVELRLDGALGLLDRTDAETLFEPDLVDLSSTELPDLERMSLWLTREAVEALGGELHISFVEGGGSTVILRIPIATATKKSP